MTIEIIILLIAIVVCVIIGVIVYRSLKRKISNLDRQLKVLAHELEQLTGTNQEMTNTSNDLRAELLRAEELHEQSQKLLSQTELQLQERSSDLNKANEEKAILFEKLKSTREKLNNQQNDILRLRERFRFDFSELAKRISNDNSNKLSESNGHSIRQFLELLKNKINEFRQKVEETYDKQSKESLSPGKEVVRSIDLSQFVSQEANNITTALKGDDKLPQWKVEQQYRNAVDIAEKADALHDRFTAFIDSIESVSKKLEEVTNCYTEAFKELSSGRGNIIARIEELKKITNKQLPGKLAINVSKDETLNKS